MQEKSTRFPDDGGSCSATLLPNANTSSQEAGGMFQCKWTISRALLYKNPLALGEITNHCIHRNKARNQRSPPYAGASGIPSTFPGSRCAHCFSLSVIKSQFYCFFAQSQSLSGGYWCHCCCKHKSPQNNTILKHSGCGCRALVGFRRPSSSFLYVLWQEKGNGTNKTLMARCWNATLISWRFFLWIHGENLHLTVKRSLDPV